MTAFQVDNFTVEIPNDGAEHDCVCGDEAMTRTRSQRTTV